MSDIYRVMVRCPATHRVSDTGIRTSGREALHSGTFQQGKAACSHCGQSHDFKQHAFFSIDRNPSGRDVLWRPNP
ncbi:MAG: hypothetical protein FJW35_14985 [Acidobacteria bacterium]|nr:hypothetical protein [Acidobacteriota bacterium]